jgi:anti-anti-sigma factor
VSDSNRTATDPPEPADQVKRLRIELTQPGELLLDGEIDGSTAAELCEALESAAAAASSLLVDLCAVTYLDSVGVGALFDQAHTNMRLRVAAGSAVATVINICGLDQIAQVEFVAAEPRQLP